METADYGKLAYLKTEELFRKVNFLEREIAKLKETVNQSGARDTTNDGVSGRCAK